MDKNELKTLKEDTKLVHSGRDPADYHGIVNPPVARGSTILYPSLSAYDDPDHRYRYGRMGNPMSEAFETAMADLEGGAGAVSAPSGLAALTVALLAFLKAGDHLLMVDSVYPPTREFCDRLLARFGVETEYYDPLIGAGIAGLIRENTSAIYMESPGSATFEIQDVPAIVEAARARGAVTMIDNTWAAGVAFKPLSRGVDISLQAATKYIGGHSDVNLGFAAARTEAQVKKLRTCALDLGVCAAPEDMSLALRGLRTLKLRLRQSAENALEVASWLSAREDVRRVYHPALPGDPNHALWRRDFTGSNGLVSVLLPPSDTRAVEAFVDGLKLFPVGSSWGGYESLLQPQNLKTCRSACPWNEEGALLRLQVGLEDPQDLIADLERAFARLHAAAA
jgi:cystathionine beta-lyase